MPLAVVLPLLLACSGEGPRNDRGARRVLVIGIDGASPRVVAPLIEQGRLPHLARLAEDGISGPLRTILPIDSPPIWNSVATGKTPQKHGIPSFARKDASGVQRLFLSSDRKVHALWNIASDAGRSVGVVNFWNTYPPERVNGAMISDHMMPREIEGRLEMTGAAEVESGAVTYPESWQGRFVALLREGAPLTPVPSPFTPGAELPAGAKLPALQRRQRDDEAIARFALEVEAELRPQLLMVLLTGIDRVSHHLWGTLEPGELYPPGLRPTEAQRAGGRAALEGYYEFTDGLIGLLLESYTADDLVIVLSDHGFEAGVTMGVLTGVHKGDAAIDGVFFARGAGIAPGSSLASGEMSVLDITPTILAWWGLPVGQDMDGSVAAFAARSGQETVATHDTGAVERLTAAPSGADEELLEQLRQLGYIE